MIKQQPKNHFKPKILGAVFLLPVLISGCGSGEVSDTKPKAIPVKLEQLETATLIDSSQYVGTLEAKERVNLAPRIQGRILKIFVQQGDRVVQGTPIVELEPTQQQEDVNAAAEQVNVEKARLAQVKAQLSQAKAQLKEAEADLARSNAEAERTRADIKDQEAQLKLAKINIERSKFLVEGGASPQQDLDDKTRDLDTQIARLNARKEALNANLKEVQAAKERVEQSQANVKQVQANIESQKASVFRAEAELGSINQNLAFNTIRAPISGRVGSFSEKKVGDVVNVGELITTITDNQVFNLNINIPTEERSRLKVGLPVEIINKDGSPGVRGSVSFISPLVNQDSQSILTKVTFPNDDSLRDRQYVQVRAIWDTKPGLLVPTVAVSTLGGQRFVFVAKPGETSEEEKTFVAEQTAIQVGDIQGQSFQVISGLEEGDKIAVNRILDLKDGTSITEESVKSEQSNSN
jgi:RND family efflux transporter MFP subunit